MKKTSTKSAYYQQVCCSKIFKIMRNTLLLLLLNVFHIYAINTYSQKTVLTMDLRDATVKEVLTQIEDQSEFFFLYNSKLIDVNRKTSLNVRDQKIDQILAQLFENTNVNYIIYDRQIILSPLEYINGIKAEPQPLQLTGQVTDASTGDPLPGVNIVVEGTTIGANTDVNGRYTIQVPDENAFLQVSFIGYTTQRVAVKGMKSIDIKLSQELKAIDEVVVVGYGTQKKIDLTGSVSVINVKEYEKAPVKDALEAMQGKVPGVQIISNSGEPGATKQIFIRGIQSWGASTDPLYIIDGVIMEDLSSLSPNDVESISILKDAASSAIYGARAANGVVLVTTKRGTRTTKPVIAFHAYSGIQQYSDLQPDLLNSSQWLMLDKESYANAGPAAYDQSPYGTQNPVDMNLFKDKNGNLIDTDWLDVVGQPGRIHNYDLSLTGGNERSNYFTSLTYFTQDGLILNTSADRISARFNSDHKIAEFLEFGNSFNIYSNSRHGGVGNPYFGAWRKNPLSRPYETDEEGNIINYDYVRCYTMEGGDVGPLILAKEYTDDRRYYGFVGNIFLKVKILPGLTFTPRLSIDYRAGQQSAFVPELHILGVETQSINHVDKNQDYNFHWITDYMLSYEKTFMDVHNVSALFIYSQEENEYEYISGTRFGTPNNKIQYLNAGQLENQSVYNGFQDWSFVSYIGRLGYNYKEKYLVQASVRRDGTSRFVDENRWGVFPSLSAGWRISKESFFEPLTDIINDLKIRASVGTLGNSNVGLYPTYATLEMFTAVMGPMGSQYASPSYALGAAVNSNVKWEQTQKNDFGIDASFFNSKVNLTADYFISHTTNLLYGKPIPLCAGKHYDSGGWIDPSDPTINGGEIENKGFEFSLGYQDKKGDFTYSINANLATARNKVLDLEGRQIREWGLEVGQPIYRFFGYTSNGIVKNQKILDDHPYLTNPENDFPIGLGDIWTVDVNGRDEEGNLTYKPDGKITADDRGFIGKKYPDFTFGLSGNVSYKNWTLQVVTYGVKGVDLNTQTDINGYFQYTSNDVTRLLDRWEATKNPDGDMPKVTKADLAQNATNMSSFWLSDASFLKIANLNLRYAVPSSICQKVKMKNLEIYGSVENLHTFTKYPGGEVDVTDQGMWDQPITKMPQPRTWVMGIKVSF